MRPALFDMSAHLLLLCCLTGGVTTSLVPPSVPSPSLPPEISYSLSSSLQANMARLIHYAFHVPGVKLESQLQCLETLCRIVDAKFTQTALSRFKQVMWQEHEGVEEEEMLELAASITRQARVTAEEFKPIPDCTEFTDSQISDVIERAALVLCRSTLQGNSANFPFLHSEGQTFAPFLNTANASWFRWLLTRTDILASAFGMAGAALVVYAYCSYYYVFKKRSSVPCQCRLCKGVFVLGQELGSGGFGKVYKCTKGGQLLVIKLIQVDPANNVNDIQDAIDEATSLVKLKHRNIVAYQDVFIHRNETETDFMCIVMELCDKGSLLDLVAAAKLDFFGLINALRQILEALVYTHAQGVLHCDIKLDNIFVLSDPSGHDQFKIGDFGLATQLKLRVVDSRPSATEGNPTPNPNTHAFVPSTPMMRERSSRRGVQDHKDMFTSTVGGTPCYQPPEVFQRLGVSPASDVWAVACLIFEAATRVDIPDSPFLGERAMTGEKRWGAERERLAEALRQALERMVRGEPTNKHNIALEDTWNQEEEREAEGDEEREDEGDEGDEGDENEKDEKGLHITYFDKDKTVGEEEKEASEITAPVHATEIHEAKQDLFGHERQQTDNVQPEAGESREQNGNETEVLSSMRLHQRKKRLIVDPPAASSSFPSASSSNTSESSSSSSSPSSFPLFLPQSSLQPPLATYKFSRSSCSSMRSSPRSTSSISSLSDEDEDDENEGEEGDEGDEKEVVISRSLTSVEQGQVSDLVQMFKDMLASAPWERPSAAALLKYSIMKEATKMSTSTIPVLASSETPV